MADPNRDVLAFGPFLFDVDDRLFRGGQQILLPPKETQLLRLLAGASGRIVSKDEILDHVWPQELVSENSITRCVHSLRGLLGERRRHGGAIETVQGRGYRFALPIRRSTPEPAIDPVRVAVAPFDTGGEDGRDYLAQGLAADVTTRLGLLCDEGIAPLARQSAQRLKLGRPARLPLARELKLDFLVLGRLRVKACQLEVVVELVRVSDELLLYSDTFSCPEDDAARLAGEIAEAVGKRLGRQTAGRTAPPTTCTTSDPRAYRALLQGDFASQNRTERGLRRAIDCYRMAIGWDPRFASAHAALAQNLFYLGVRGYAAPLELLPEARAALSRALDLDERNPLALSALAFLRWTIDRNPAAALAIVDRGVRFAPHDDQLPWRRSQILMTLGRFEEALADQRRSLARNPFAVNTMATHAHTHYFAGHLEDALAMARLVAEAEPEFAGMHALRATAAAVLGRREEALAAAAAADVVARSDQVARSTCAHARALLGQEDEARADLAALQRTAKRRYVSQTCVAVVHMGLGEREAALACLERALADRCLWLPYVATDPRFAPLREVARFREIAALVTGERNGGATRVAKPKGSRRASPSVAVHER